MKFMQPPSVAIFFMIHFQRAGGAMAPSPPPGSAIGILVGCVPSTSMVVSTGVFCLWVQGAVCLPLGLEGVCLWVRGGSACESRGMSACGFGGVYCHSLDIPPTHPLDTHTPLHHTPFTLPPPTVDRKTHTRL